MFGIYIEIILMMRLLSVSCMGNGIGSCLNCVFDVLSRCRNCGVSILYSVLSMMNSSILGLVMVGNIGILYGGW